mgnify:CR=1 FL=1
MFSLKLFGGASIQAPTGPLTGRATQRRRIALLAILAVARSRGVSRDKVIAFLWPEQDADHGRPLLSDSIYRVNQALGGEAIIGTADDLRLSGDVLPSDVAAFEDAIERGEWQRAAEIYAGPFLDGFFLSGAEEFERCRRLIAAIERSADEGRGQVVSEATPFQDTDAIATTKEFAEKNNLKSVADLKGIPPFTLGARPEFKNRFNGLKGMAQVYGVKDNVKFKQLALGLQYPSLDKGDVDTANVFSTDAQLACVSR